MSPNRAAHVDEVRPVTALFADVVGSTGLGEKLSVAEVKAVVGECVSRMCEAIEALGGVVTGQMGDGIAAFFGLEGAREDDSVRAARAALEIREVVAAFAQEVREAWGVEDLNVRIGLNGGRVAAGPVGGQEPTVIALGDAVNVAARLQAAAKPGGVVVGATLLNALTERFVLTDLGPLLVKGRTEPVHAYELNGVVERARRIVQHSLIGRNRELADALAPVEELEAGRGQILTIVGDGGIGKTRLLAEMRDHVAEQVLWLEANCDGLDARFPYDPIEQILRAFLEVDRSVNGIHLRARFRTVVHDLLGQRFDACAPQLARLLGIELDDRLMRRLDGLTIEVLQKSLRDAFVEWVDVLSARSPVVLVFDNLHDATEATTELVDAVVEELERLPVWLVLAIRPVSSSPGWRTRIGALANHAPRCQDVQLRPLDDDASRALIASLQATPALSQSAVEAVIQRAEGNPLYIEQLIASVTDEALPDDVPHALESFLLARIDSFSSSSRRALQAGAILGRTFDESALERMIGACSDSISELLRGDVLREFQRTPRRYTFRHGLLRDAALATLTPERLTALHASAAAAIEAGQDYDIERDGPELARHLIEADQSVRAAGCLESIGDRLTLVYRTSDALTSFERALQVLRDNGDLDAFARVVLKACDALGVLGKADEAISLIDEAHSLSGIPERVRERLSLAKATRLSEVDRADEAQKSLSELLIVAEAPEIIGPALVLRGWIALGQQDLDVARTATDALARLAADTAEMRFEVASLAGGLAAHAGDFSLAYEKLEEAQLIAEEMDRLPAKLIASRRVGVALRFLGRVRESFDTLLAVLKAYREVGSVVGVLETAVNVVGCALHLGELEIGRRVAVDALGLTDEPSWRAMLISSLVGIESELGRESLTTGLLNELKTLEINAPPWVRDARVMVEAECLASAGKWVAARELVRTYRTEPHSGRDGETAALDVTRAAIASRLGLCEEAEDFVAQALKRLPACESCSAVVVQRSCAEVLLRLDKPEGRFPLHAALESARRFGMRLDEARCLVALGEFEPDGREQNFADARRIFEECGCKLGLQELERAEQAVAGLSSVSP